MAEEIKTKVCKKCNKEKNLIKFHVDRTKKDGLRITCKDCIKKEGKIWRAQNKKIIADKKKKSYQLNKEEILIKRKEFRENNREILREHDRKSYSKRKKNNPIKFLLSRIKKISKKRNLEFNLDLEYLQTFYTESCPILEIKLEYNNKKNPKDNSASIDRIDSSKGYIKGNIRIISYKLNILKRDGTKEEFQKLIEFYKNPKINNIIYTIDKINKLKTMYKSAKYRAKKYNRIFNITLEDLKSLYTETCPIFKFPFSWGNNTKKIQDNSPSLDRIDNSKGYEIDNIIIVSHRANSLKSNASIKELQLIHDRAFEPIISY